MIFFFALLKVFRQDYQKKFVREPLTSQYTLDKKTLFQNGRYHDYVTYK